MNLVYCKRYAMLLDYLFRTSIEQEMTSLAKTATTLSIVILLFTSCSSNSSPTLPDADFFVQAGQPFLLRVGDTAGVVVPTAIVLVRFNGVFEDSRCPVDVTCVQAGHALVSLSVQTTLTLQEIQIEVPPQGGAQQVVEEITLDVIEVRPPAQEGVTIEFLDYQVAMSVLSTGNPLPTS
ncbi:MAG TPA: hypothetical protein VEK15_11835 [Vicinamibacteria bacterium]|nr:hypothetical protein [Vicinamibacteria bacterium]